MSSSKPALLCRDELNAMLLSSCHQRPHTATHLQARHRAVLLSPVSRTSVCLSVLVPCVGVFWWFTTDGPSLQSSSSTLCFTSALLKWLHACSCVFTWIPEVPPNVPPSSVLLPSQFSLPLTSRPSPESWELLANEMGLLSQVCLPLLTEGGGRTQWGGGALQRIGRLGLGQPTYTD